MAAMIDCQGCQNDDGCYAERFGECAEFDRLVEQTRARRREYGR